jgi:hypothetical protein
MPIPSSSKFQLPSLNIPSSSLTEGTSIPAPPPSPPREPSPRPIHNFAQERKPSLPLKTAYSSSHLRDLSPGAPPSPADSPNPLRSHPTSSHSLVRKFSGSPLVGNGDEQENRDISSNGPYQIGSSHYLGSYGRETTPENYKRSAPTHNGNIKRVPSTSSTAPSSQISPPPPKRPLSVRKLLSLRAINSAFGRSSSDGGPRASVDGSGLNNYAQSQGKKSSDNLSMFSFATTNTSATGPSEPQRSVRKRRSSAFWGRRGSSFLGLSVEEEPGTHARADMDDTDDTMDVDSAEKQHVVRQGTPPPMLPDVNTLEKGAKDSDGGFLGGGDMFKDIR